MPVLIPKRDFVKSVEEQLILEAVDLRFNHDARHYFMFSANSSDRV